MIPKPLKNDHVTLTLLKTEFQVGNFHKTKAGGVRQGMTKLAPSKRPPIGFGKTPKKSTFINLANQTMTNQPPQKPDAVAFIKAAKLLSEAQVSPKLKKLLEAKLIEEAKIYRAEQRARLRELKMREMRGRL